MNEVPDRDFFVRVGVLIATCTLLLTASFVGLLAFVSGEITGVQGRIPWYLNVGAFAFVGTIILLEAHGSSGRVIIVNSFIVTVLAVILVPLAVEGFLFAVRNPEQVFVSQLVLYLFAAALIGTGVGYWGLNHWREFTGPSSSSQGL